MNNFVFIKTKKVFNLQINKLFFIFIISCFLSSCTQLNEIKQGVTGINQALIESSASLETKKKKDSKVKKADIKNKKKADAKADRHTSSMEKSTVQMNALGKHSSIIRKMGGVSVLTRDSEPDIEMETGKSFKMPMKLIYQYAEFADIVGKSDDTINAYFNKLDYNEFQIKEIADYGLKYLMFINDTCQFIVIRGTKNFKNAMTDLMAVPWYDKQLKIWMHSGFRNAGNALFKEIEAEGIDKNKKFVIVGHSLGGTIACILGIHLFRNGYKLNKIVTFGQPKFTDEKGAHKYRMLPIIRVVGSQDIITILPPTTDIVVFSHLGLKILVDKKNIQYEKVGSAFNYKDDVVLPRNPDYITILQSYTHLMKSYFEKLRPHMEKNIKINFENKHNWLSKKPIPQT
jgi:hypothetical protein